MSESSREWGKFRPALQPLPDIDLAKLVEILQQRGFHATEAQEAAELIRDRDAWYYRIQFPPDLWTTTFRFESVAITRTLLSRAGLRGASVLDIGTMEGMIPMLARAAGANRVVGYDRLRNGRNRVALVQRVYGREFEHSTGQSLADFRRQSDEQFDVVVFSGVLCHMFDPLGGLALAASFAKPGGLLIFESSAIVREDCALHFNRRGRYYPEANFFQPTAEALDHFFRFIGLAAIDGEYFIQRTFPAPLIRIGVTCRVTAKPLPSPGDSWMKQGFEVDFGEFRLGRRNKNIEVPDLIKYVGIDRSKAVDPQTGTMNIPWFIERYPALRISAAMTELSLAAAAVSNPPAASVPL